MKFKLNKTEHLSKVQLLNKISKNKITLNENKAIASDSLVFYCLDNKIYVYSSNSISSSMLYLCDFQDEFYNFGVESNLFNNAFSNFPADEIQFVFANEENQLVFGNKKTRVALSTLQANNFDEILNSIFFLSEDIKFKKLDVENLINLIKFSAFSCAPDFDEHPYSSIMFFLKDGEFNSQSSDKHRISIFGSRFSNEQSYLIAKNQAELLLNFLNKDEAYTYCIFKNKLIIKWQNNIFVTSLENNSYQSVYNSFNKFFDESKHVTSFTIDKNQVIKSLRFISNITSSHTFNLRTNGNELIISSSRDDKGAVADKILLDEAVDSIDVSYLINHFIKALEIVNLEQITLAFNDYNGYTICVLHDMHFNHIMFPME